MNRQEREDALEAAIRRRTVKGWAFKDLPLAERCAIEAFLDGGAVPAGYERRYQLECQIAREKPGTGRPGGKPGVPEIVMTTGLAEPRRDETRLQAYDRGYRDASTGARPSSGYEAALTDYAASRELAYYTGYGAGKFANRTGRLPQQRDKDLLQS